MGHGHGDADANEGAPTGMYSSTSTQKSNDYITNVIGKLVKGNGHLVSLSCHGFAFVKKVMGMGLCAGAFGCTGDLWPAGGSYVPASGSEFVGLKGGMASPALAKVPGEDR